MLGLGGGDGPATPSVQTLRVPDPTRHSTGGLVSPRLSTPPFTSSHVRRTRRGGRDRRMSRGDKGSDPRAGENLRDAGCPGRGTADLSLLSSPSERRGAGKPLSGADTSTSSHVCTHVRHIYVHTPSKYTCSPYPRTHTSAHTPVPPSCPVMVRLSLSLFL